MPWIKLGASTTAQKKTPGDATPGESEETTDKSVGDGTVLSNPSGCISHLFYSQRITNQRTVTVEGESAVRFMQEFQDLLHKYRVNDGLRIVAPGATETTDQLPVWGRLAKITGGEHSFLCRLDLDIATSTGLHVNDRDHADIFDEVEHSFSDIDRELVVDLDTDPLPGASNSDDSHNPESIRMSSAHDVEAAMDSCRAQDEEEHHD